MYFWILDTDHVSLLQRNEPILLQKFNQMNPQNIAITIITAEEQIRGRLNLIRRATTTEQIISAYTKLQITIMMLNQLHLLNFDSLAYQYYEELRRQKIRVGTQDLRIAAIALFQKAVVVTRNQRDFSQVPGLILEDWTVI